MATSSPPSNAIFPTMVNTPQTDVSGDPLSNALNFLEELRNAGLSVAPLMPEPEALQKAAVEAGISHKQALKAYLTILQYD